MKSRNMAASLGRTGRRAGLVLGAIVLGVGMSVAMGVTMASAAAASHPPVVVSLTFDDTLADQMQADTMMANHGMHGTFYINSSRLGSTDYMTTSDALSLQAHGNEVGGHTVTHANLPTLTTDEAKRQVCNDRVGLLGVGLRVTDFAYPFGAENSTDEKIVRDCGYNSARGIGDIVSPGTCDGCPFAETIPPLNAYALDTPDSIKDNNTLQDMENYVLQAEQHSGGWVILVMHHICDDCNLYSVPAAQLDAFLSWLAPRASTGTTVKTVNEVIGGSLSPGVNGPQPPPPPSTTNLLRNPSMESINSSDGIPTCWQRGGYGTNSFTWSNTSDAQSGSTAERVQISSYTDGDRKIISPQDLGACAPATEVGHTYRVQGWYKTNGTARLVAYYRNSLGAWIFFAQGPALTTSSSYVQASWTTPALPAGSSALSVGFSLRSVGYLQADNMRLNDSNQNGDNVPPTAAITSPANGATVTGTTTIVAGVSDNVGIARVWFYLDGTALGSRIVTPYQWHWDTTTTTKGTHSLYIIAIDTNGNQTQSATITVTVT